MKILISNDNGLRWSTVNSSYGTNTNIFCVKPVVEVNITELAAGMPSVLIRFQWNSNSHYFWCLDDLEFSEAYHNELRLETTYLYMTDLNTEDKDEGFYYMVPFSQLGTSHLGEYTFKGIIFNGGMDDVMVVHILIKFQRMENFLNHIFPLMEIPPVHMRRGWVCRWCRAC